LYAPFIFPPRFVFSNFFQTFVFSDCVFLPLPQQGKRLCPPLSCFSSSFSFQNHTPPRFSMKGPGDKVSEFVCVLFWPPHFFIFFFFRNKRSLLPSLPPRLSRLSLRSSCNGGLSFSTRDSMRTRSDNFVCLFYVFLSVSDVFQQASKEKDVKDRERENEAKENELKLEIQEKERKIEAKEADIKAKEDDIKAKEDDIKAKEDEIFKEQMGENREMVIRYFRQSLAREEQSLAREEQSLAREEQSLAREEQSLAREEQSLAREEQSLDDLRNDKARLVDPSAPGLFLLLFGWLVVGCCLVACSYSSFQFCHFHHWVRLLTCCRPSSP
jgi:hypothetical protein